MYLRYNIQLKGFFLGFKNMEREVVICYVYCVSDTRNEGGNYCSEMVRRALEFQRQQHAIPLKVRQQHISTLRNSKCSKVFSR